MLLNDGFLEGLRFLIRLNQDLQDFQISRIGKVADTSAWVCKVFGIRPPSPLVGGVANPDFPILTDFLINPVGVTSL